MRPSATQPPAKGKHRLSTESKTHRDERTENGDGYPRQGVRGALRRVQDSAADPIEILGALWGLTGAIWKRSPRIIRSPMMVVTRTFQAYFHDSCHIYAAAIAYYSIFSLIPLAIITMALLDVAVTEDQIVEFIYVLVPVEETEELTDVLREIVGFTRNVSIAVFVVGVVALGWSASGVFSAIRQGLNAASHLKTRQSFFRGKAIDLALIPAFGALLYAGLIINGFTQFVLNELAGWEAVEDYQDILSGLNTFVVAAVFSFVFFLIMYRLVPSSRPGWKEAAVAALCATILFELVRFGAAVLVGYMPWGRGTAVYSGLATALALLYVMRIVGSIILVGAEFGRIVVRWNGAEAEELVTRGT